MTYTEFHLVALKKKKKKNLVVERRELSMLIRW